MERQTFQKGMHSICYDFMNQVAEAIGRRKRKIHRKLEKIKKKEDAVSKEVIFKFFLMKLNLG